MAGFFSHSGIFFVFYSYCTFFQVLFHVRDFFQVSYLNRRPPTSKQDLLSNHGIYFLHLHILIQISYFISRYIVYWNRVSKRKQIKIIPTLAFQNTLLIYSSCFTCFLLAYFCLRIRCPTKTPFQNSVSRNIGKFS